MRAITAEESLIEIERLSVPYMERAEQRKLIARWRRWAGGKSEKKDFRKTSAVELARMGLGRKDANR